MWDRLRRFMAGRYGYDHLSRMLNIVCLACILVAMIFRMFGGKYVYAVIQCSSASACFGSVPGFVQKQNQTFGGKSKIFEIPKCILYKAEAVESQMEKQENL